MVWDRNPYFLIDNGSALLTSRGFQAHLAAFSQIIHFTGVGAHHQNGHAKHAIQTVMWLLLEL
jgi:hypothetical protein